MAHARTVGQTHIDLCLPQMRRNTSTSTSDGGCLGSWVLAMAHKQLQMRNSRGLERLSSAAWQIFYVNAANDAVIFPRMPTFIYLSLSLPSFSLFPFSVSASRTLAAAITLRKTLRVSITTGSRGRKTERERGRVCMWEREKDRIGHTLGDTHSRSWLQQQQLVSSQIR